MDKTILFEMLLFELSKSIPLNFLLSQDGSDLMDFVIACFSELWWKTVQFSVSGVTSCSQSSKTKMLDTLPTPKGDQKLKKKKSLKIKNNN